MRKARIQPLKIEKLEDADRFADQVTDSVNELLGGVHFEQVSYSGDFRAGELVKIPHKQDQKPIGFICTNGVKLTLVSVDDTFLNVMVDPWYSVPAENSNPVPKAATKIFWKNLNGGRDQAYRFNVFVKVVIGATRSFEWFVNGASPAADDAQQLMGSGATASAAAYAATTRIEFTGSDQFHRQGIFWVAHGLDPLYHAVGSTWSTGSSLVRIFSGGFDEASNVETLELNATGAFIGAGSVLLLERLNPPQTEIQLLVY